VIGLLLVLVVVLGLAWLLSLHQLPPDAAQQRAAISLHGIRRRLEVAQFRSEVQAEAAAARRELREALDETDSR
jgi:hypothetical protein